MPDLPASGTPPRWQAGPVSPFRAWRDHARVEQDAVFQSNRSHAVLLPKAASAPDGAKCVDIIAIGRTPTAVRLW